MGGGGGGSLLGLLQLDDLHGGEAVLLHGVRGGQLVPVKPLDSVLNKKRTIKDYT